MVSRRKALAVLTAMGLLGAYIVPGACSGYQLEETVVCLGLGGRKAVFLSDIHCHCEDRRDLVLLLERVKPDMLLVGGDTFDELTSNLSCVESLLAELRRHARHCLAVLGNHELWSIQKNKFSMRETRQVFENAAAGGC